MKKIYFDENMSSSLARGIQHLDQPNNSRDKKCEILFLPDVYHKGIKDPDWIPILGKEKAVVITKDLNIYRTHSNRELYEKHGLGLILVKLPSKKGATYWELVQQIVRHWEKIRSLAVEKNPPFVYQCAANGVKQI